MANSINHSSIIYNNSGLDFSNQTIKADTLSYKVFENCQFQNTTIVGDLSQIEFKDCDFSNATFQQVQLGSFQSCNFYGAKLSEVITDPQTKLINCDFTGSTLSFSPSAKKFMIAGCRFDNINEQTTNIDVLECMGYRLIDLNNRLILLGPQLDYSKMDLTGLSIKDISLINSSFKEAILDFVTFREVECGSSDFEGANMHGAKITWSGLSHANFQNVTIEGAHFDACDFNYSLWVNSKVTDSRFNFVSADGTNFSSADLSSTRFMSSRLEWANMSNTVLNDAWIMDSKTTGICFDGASMIKYVLKQNGLFNPVHLIINIIRGVANARIKLPPGTTWTREAEDSHNITINR